MAMTSPKMQLNGVCPHSQKSIYGILELHVAIDLQNC